MRAPGPGCCLDASWRLTHNRDTFRHCTWMYDPSTTALIVNPAAAAGRVGRSWSTLWPRLRDVLGDVDVRTSDAPGDARRLAADALRDGAETVLSLGGDGTHNEVVNGFADADVLDGTRRLGILPAGTGGDLRRMLHTGDGLVGAANEIRDRDAHPVDIGRLTFEDHDGTRTVRHFVNVASFGMSGLVDRFANASSKRLGGRVTFLVATFRALARWTGMDLELVIDGAPVSAADVQNVVLGNARYFGGGMHVCPNARLDDGFFDVVTLPELSVLKAARHIPRVYRGTHLELPGVGHWRARRVEARTTRGTAWLDVDGEAPGVAPVVAEVIPRAIRLIGVRADVLQGDA